MLPAFAVFLFLPQIYTVFFFFPFFYKKSLFYWKSYTFAKERTIGKSEKRMIQVVKEKFFKFEVGKMTQIDNMIFKIKEMYIDGEDDGNDFSITIWGNKPNATTISKQRIVRIDDLLWRPRHIDVFTESGKTLSPFRKNGDLKIFIEHTGKDKVKHIIVEMETSLNPLIIYDFD